MPARVRPCSQTRLKSRCRAHFPSLQVRRRSPLSGRLLVGFHVGWADKMGESKTTFTAIDVPRLLAPGMHFFGDGLYLQVTGPERRSWIFRYSFQGKPRWKGL